MISCNVSGLSRILRPLMNADWVLLIIRYATVVMRVAQTLEQILNGTLINVIGLNCRILSAPWTFEMIDRMPKFKHKISTIPNEKP